MDLRLTPGTMSSNAVTAISSKSYVHRLLIVAALFDGPFRIITNIISKDMDATVGALNSLGADITVEKRDDASYSININRPLGKKKIENCTIDCGESGSTARFILPVAPCFAKNAKLTGSGRLPERPMGPLCDVLRASGVSVSADTLPITLSGRPSADRFRIAGNVSSQYISGLLFMMPLLDGSSVLEIEGGLESASYVDMTVDVLKKFGIDIRREGNTFSVFHKPDTCALPDNEIIAEGDWSNAAYMMALAAAAKWSLGTGLVDHFEDHTDDHFEGFIVNGLAPDSIQGDSAIISILKDFGVSVEIVAEDGSSCGYRISGRPKRPVDVDCSQIPDLVPALAVLAAYAGGDSIFRNVGRLRMKECDRIEAVSELLAAVSVAVDITSENRLNGQKEQNSQNSRNIRENMIVHGRTGPGNIQGDIVINSFNDHRIAMAAAALAFAENTSVVIRDAMAVNKSYPGFFEEIKKLGVSISEV